DRFEEAGVALPHRVLDRHGTGDLERLLARVDRVVGAVHQRDDDVEHRITRHYARGERVADALLGRRYVFAGNSALRDLVLEDESRAALPWLDVQLDVADLDFVAGLPSDDTRAVGRVVG